MSHTPTIAVVNQKGGVGKSFIADEIAFHCEREGIVYGFFDLDDQGGTYHTSAGASEDEAEVRIVDTPGALKANLRFVLEESDVVVVPVRPSERGVPASEHMLELVERVAKDAVHIVVVNCWNRFVSASQFAAHEREWVGRGWRVFHIPQAELVTRAEAVRRSVVELDRRARVSKAVGELCAAVVEEVI